MVYFFSGFKKAIISVFILANIFCSTAQNKMADYLEVSNAFSDKMNNSVTWIDSTFSKIFISNFQFSESYKHDSSFYSFNLIANKTGKIKLYKLDGITLNPDFSVKGKRFLTSKSIAAELLDEKSAYLTSFNYGTFKYTNRAYYDLALKIIKLGRFEILANTFNYCVEPKNDKIDKYDQFINDVNKKNNLKLNYISKNKSISDLDNYLRNNFVDLNDLIYKTYISDTDEEKSKDNLNQFFRVVGLFENNVISTIDRMLIEKLRLKFEKTEILEFPQTILKTTDGTIGQFAVERIEMDFDCKKQQSEILLYGKLNSKCYLINGKEISYKNGKQKLKKTDSKEIAPFDILKITIDNKTIRLEASYTDLSEEYLIVVNKF